MAAARETQMLVAESREGQEVAVPVASVRGASDGPTLLVVAGVHGSEYVGIEATRRLFQRVDAGSLRGRSLTVPCFGLPAFYGLQAHTSPVDGIDPGRAFPGDPNGPYTERAADLVGKNLAHDADAVIDVHGGDLEEELVEYSQITLSGDPGVDAAGEALARSLAFPLFVRAPRPTSPQTSMSLFVAAAAAGIPGVLAEAGSHGVLDLELAETNHQALRNALVHLGMIDGAPAQVAEPQLLHRFEG